MSIAATILSELAKQIRESTLEVLQGAPRRSLLFAPAGTSNHIIWHAGHALWLADRLCIELLTGASELPDRWEQRFGMRCDPVAAQTDWPDREHLGALLKRQLQRCLQLIDSASDAELTAIAEPQRGPATIADRIIHGWHDEARHNGEMYLLYKLYQADTGVRSP